MTENDSDNGGVLAGSEVEARLKRELPRWYEEQGFICRDYRTGGWRATLMLANAVGHLAELAFHHPDLHLSYGLLKVTLKTHSADGITEKDLELARRIEALITWQPAGEEGALEGIPDDPKFKYVEYD